MTLCHSDCSHIQKTYVFSIISIHKNDGVDLLLVVELDAERSVLMAESALLPILRADGAPRLNTMIPCISWMLSRGEKKEPGLPNKIYWGR